MEKKYRFYKIIFVVSLLLWTTFGYSQTITNFQPTTGSIGSLITITGTSLNSPTAVTVGGTATVIVSSSATQIVAMVMPGTATGAVSVTTAGGTANSGTFTITTPNLPIQQQGFVKGTAAGYLGKAVALSADGNTAALRTYISSGRFEVGLRLRIF